MSRALIGLAHYRPFPPPLAGGTGGYLDDLYVAAAATGWITYDMPPAPLEASAPPAAPGGA